MKNAKLLRHAARLLEAEAEVTRLSCQGGERWACGTCAGERDRQGRCPAQRRHDDQIATAKQLRKAAA